MSGQASAPVANEPLKVGLIGGGGPGAFIAHPHVRAILMDGTRQVVCGALRSDPEASLEAAARWPFPLHGYSDWKEMLRAEKDKPAGERVDYVLITTPNHAHHEPACGFLEADIPVFLEKPMTMTVAEAESLAGLVEQRRVPFCLAHTYLGHWTTRLARHMVRSGLIGEVRWVDSSYLQGWLADHSNDQGQQAAWRIDPARTGISNCGGDIGTHALMQLRYVTGLEVEIISSHFEKMVPGRALDDHFTVYGRLSNGGRALIRASQIAIGHKNDLSIEVNGASGSLYWNQESPEQLQVSLPGQPDRIYYRGAVTANDGFLKDLPTELLQSSLLPSGHGEALHDAFARLHRDFEKDVRAYQAGAYAPHDGSRYATVQDGLAGMRFIEQAVKMSREG